MRLCIRNFNFRKLTMKKLINSTTTTHLVRAAFSLVLIFIAVQFMMPLALGQRKIAAPEQCTWGAGPDMPSVGVRMVGVYFPANGKFYAMGGRSADTAGSDFTHPFEYDPVANSWTTKGAFYPDNQVNNMACGVLTDAGTPYIYCVGGSAAGNTTAIARVFRYNPVTDAITTLAGDDWPGDTGTILPGGFAVTGNKMYILGGFNINVASTNQIWEFDPTAAVGSKWVQRVNTPVGIMYAPTAAIGGIIYVGGASDYSGGTVIDTTNSFSFNPATNLTGAIATIPRATGETRALAFNGKMLVMGGGRVSPNPVTEVDAYDPVANTWAVNTPVPAYVTPRRNFPTDTDGTTKIWLAGGYDFGGFTPLASMEIFNCPSATLSGAVSRKTHIGAGNFDIALPAGTECRTGGGTNDFTIVATFTGPVTVNGSPQAQVISGSGCVGTGGVCSGGAVTISGNDVTIPLTNITNAQTITVRLNAVNGGGNVDIMMTRLLADTNGTNTVSSADVAQTKSRIGQTLTQGSLNFRSDINLSGGVNSTDVTIVKSNIP